MNLKPLTDRVIIKRETEEEVTAGGLYIPDSAKEKPARGEVVAVGPQVEAIKAGEIAMFAKYTGHEFSAGGEELLIMREEDILAIVE